MRMQNASCPGAKRQRKQAPFFLRRMRQLSMECKTEARSHFDARVAYREEVVELASPRGGENPVPETRRSLDFCIFMAMTWVANMGGWTLEWLSKKSIEHGTRCSKYPNRCDQD